jgi:Fe-S cluster assembly protein SufB
MSKYTEDDLKSNSKKKRIRIRILHGAEAETFPIGLNEDIVRAIQKRRTTMDDRLAFEAFRAWEQMIEPEWANVHYANLIFAISYYSAPKAVDPNKTLDDVDPELLEMYKKVRYPVMSKNDE